MIKLKHFFRVREEYGGKEINYRSNTFKTLDEAVENFKQYPQDNVTPLIITEERWINGRLTTTAVYDIDGERM